MFVYTFFYVYFTFEYEVSETYVDVCIVNDNWAHFRLPTASLARKYMDEVIISNGNINNIEHHYNGPYRG